jgi:cytochrome c biogenesis protein CcmG/thiol:disulfide interchange protein DsbE
MSTAAARPRRLLALLPLVAFGALALVFLMQLYGGDPSKLPSALIGRAVPAFALPPLEPGGKGLADADLRQGKLTLVNVFASWCGPCHEEHPFLMELAKDGRFNVVGINYKDLAENARRFLGARGNPYAAIGVDNNGRAAIDWGVYGVPETFLVRGDGTIAYKLVGPINADSLKAKLGPEIETALAKKP